MAFMVENEEFEPPREATPGELWRRGFYVKPEDVDRVATLLAREIEIVNVNLRRIYGKGQRIAHGPEEAELDAADKLCPF